MMVKCRKKEEKWVKMERELIVGLRGKKWRVEMGKIKIKK